MATIERLALLITADGAGAVRELDKVGKSASKNLGGAETTVSKFSSSLIRGGAAATVGGASILAGLAQAADGAQGLADSVDKADAIFGSVQTGGLDTWAADAAKNLGLTKEQALDTAAAYGVLLKGAGVTGQALANQSKDLAGITIDIAERFKLDPKTVQDKIATALKGGKGAKALLDFGIDISDVKIDEEGVRRKLIKAGEKLTREQKVVIAADIISRSDARGEFQRSVNSGDIGAVQKASLAELQNAYVELGRNALPVLVKLTQAASTFVKAISGGSGAVGQIAAYGAAAAVALGPLSTLVGTVGKLGGLAAKGLKLGASAADAAATGALAGAQQAVATTAGEVAVAEGAATTGIAAEGTAAGVAAVENEALAASQVAAAASGKGLSGILATISSKAGIAAVGVGGLAAEYVILSGYIDDAAKKNLELAAINASDINFAAEDPRQKNGRRNVFATRLFAGIDNAPTSESITPGSGATATKAEVIAADAERIKAAVSAWDPTKAREYLDSLKAIATEMGRSPEEIKALFGSADQAVDDAARSAKLAGTSFADMGNEAKAAADPVGLLAKVLAGTADAASSLADANLTGAQVLDQVLGPVEGLIDAQQRLEDAQKSARESAERDAKGIRDAYEGVADAKAQLDELLAQKANPNTEFGLRSVTPEQQIADARKRLASANVALSKNPDDAKAQTAKDEALQDLDRASKVAQDAKRNAAQLDKQIAASTKNLKRAEEAVPEAVKRAQDDAATNARNVADAEKAKLRAEIELGGLAATAKDGLKGIAADLDALAAKGLIPPSLAADFKAHIDDMGQAAVNVYNLLNGLAKGQVPGTPTAGGAGTPGGGAAERPDLTALRPGAKQPPAKPKYPPIPVGQSFRHDLPSAGIPRDGYVTTGRPDPNGSTKIQYRYDASRGQWIPQFAKGGIVPGTGSGDTVPAMLTPGEIVMRKEAVNKLGAEQLLAMNSQPQRFANGGMVGRTSVATSIAVSSPRAASVETSAAPVTFAPSITIHASDPRSAGQAVVSELRDVATRSGRGVRITDRVRVR